MAAFVRLESLLVVQTRKRGLLGKCGSTMQKEHFYTKLISWPQPGAENDESKRPKSVACMVPLFFGLRSIEVTREPAEPDRLRLNRVK